MNYDWFDGYCFSKKGTEKDYKIEWEATRYLVGGKMFAIQGEDKNKKPIFTIKCEPSFGEFLRNQYEHIVPGYYMNKLHWNSIYIDGDVPDEVLKQMIDVSYELILSSLSKKVQNEIKLLDEE
ncbi:MAG: MmcQ/YjbR family DNA-binding protein [Clostridiaceae bacterium]